FKSVIDEWLYEDKKARRKQRHTAKRIYDRLKDPKEGIRGFDCSYRTVAGYVAVKRKEIFGKEKSAYIPLRHIPGEAQVDFGESDFYLNSQLFSGKHLNLSFPHSNQGYVQLFKGENQQCLFEGLLAIFTHIGGVPSRLWFDNTSTIVTKILKNGGRNLTDDFLRFMEHYRFEAAFCNAHSGHEKGNVEGKVGYHRRNLLVPVPRIENLQDFNQELLSRCDADAQREHYRKDAAINELYQEDCKALLPLP
ncbi:IS21 family transposase, partial [Dethiobacter alkaliphilus]|uniref:IS21 family transposase n=1 Tax=Dethiobacter alkaliphilus TaxID=427926 RepID=UPI002227EE0D